MTRKLILRSAAFIFLLATIFSCLPNKSVDEFNVFSNYIQLEGEENMRDLGGLSGHEGRRLLYRKLFRSGALNKLSSADKDSLAVLGIKQVIDLRTPLKYSSAPDNIPESIERFNLTLFKNNYNENLSDKILDKSLNAEAFMLDAYQGIDSLKISSWTKLFKLLENDQPTLWHCSSGKDRAGMTTALVLSSLGVSRAQILSDYLQTNEYLQANNHEQFIKAYGAKNAKLFEPFEGVKRTYLNAFFGAIDEKYGSMENFLVRLDVDIEKMRNNFLSPSPVD